MAIGNYKGVPITKGTDAEIAAQMAAIDAGKGGLPSLPEGGGAMPSPYQLPQSGGEQSPILSFASSLDAAVNIARKKRNELSLGLMTPFQGTVAASDFNSILGNLNKASDTTSQDLIKRATESQTPDIYTATDDNGNVRGIDKATGTVIWTAKGVGNRQTGPNPSGKITDAELKQFINKQIATPEFQVLSPEEKALYIQSQGGTPYDFDF